MGSGDYKFLYNDVFSKDPAINNRFNTYKPEFDYEAISGILDKINSNQKDRGMKSLGGLLDKNKRSTRASLASSGITGGPIMNDLLAGAEDRVGEQTSDFLSNLGDSRLNAEIPLMQTANNDKFRTTMAATNVDEGNVSRGLQRSGLINSILGGMTQAQNYEANAPTWLDDLFGGINAAANVTKAIAGIPGI